MTVFADAVLILPPPLGCEAPGRQGLVSFTSVPQCAGGHYTQRALNCLSQETAKTEPQFPQWPQDGSTHPAERLIS